MMQPTNKLELVEAIVQRRVKNGDLTREPTVEEWAAAWKVIKSVPDMPEDLIANSAFAHLKPNAALPKTPTVIERVQMAAVSTAMPREYHGKICPNCKKEVADNARTCPQCGHTFTTAGGIFIAVLIALIIGGCISITWRPH